MLENMFATSRNMQSGSTIESVAGLRVTETSFDDERGTFVIKGSLEFGRVSDGLEVCLPSTEDQYVYLPIHAVDIVEGSVGTPYLAVSVLVPYEGRRMLEGLNVTGDQLRLVRRTVEASGKETSTGEAGWQLIPAVLSLLILVVAFFLPAALGSSGPKSVVWTASAVVIFVGAVVLIHRNLQWSLLVLCIACVFFLATCSENLNLHLD